MYSIPKGRLVGTSSSASLQGTLEQRVPRNPGALNSTRTRPYLSGPIDLDWIVRAADCGRTPLLVGLLLWHKMRLTKNTTIEATSSFFIRFGIDGDAKVRALRKLEQAGLVEVDRRGKRNPAVRMRYVPNPQDAHLP